MANKHLSRLPQNINSGLWYYEEPRGINIVYPIHKDGVCIRTDCMIIPWHKIRNSLKRKLKT